MLAIKNNIMAGNAARHLGKAYDSLAKSVERLSSGLRINSSRDDAAGLAVRELMRADIAVLQQGARNAQDGISMLQTMEGAMAVIDDNLVRMKELAEQAATGSYSDAQRAIMNAEFAEMADEIDRIAEATKFNDIAMLNSSTGSVSIHVGTSTTIDINKVNMTKGGLGINTGVEVDEVIFKGTESATTDDFLTVADNAVNLVIQFSNSADGTSEDAITIDLATGSYSMAAVVSAINAQTQALGYAPDGTDKSYNMASIVTNDDGTYSLKLSSRDEADAVSIQVVSATTDQHGTVSGLGGTATTSTNAGADLNTDNYDEAQVAGGVNIATAAAAAEALATITAAINTKDQARASFGYKMNRLESTIEILDIQAENLSTAESRISDVDVATEMAALTRTQVLSQAGISMLAQANQMPQMALQLLR
ncbi:MAG TPA: flagellin [Anaerohalosphaeraceae bacterium]|nr:flagellin [Anaerohalosphaeraceae bacterium]HPO69477.1 flagellin [Anaerohalosphaeraceae bacterium]HRS71056.1 flagellin [Anaerohalosphaeraceae bacterium]